MTATIAGTAADGATDLLAENLSVLLARCRRKVLLMDATPGHGCLEWGIERKLANLRP